MSLYELLSDPQGYYRRQHQQEQRDSNASAMRGLLNVYQSGNQDHPISAQQQKGLLETGALPAQFYQRAGTIPGYENLMAQAQTGQQAMGRQTQQQDWNANNMTMAQREQLAARAQEAQALQGHRQAQLGQQQAQWEGVSGNQQAVIDAQNARGNTGPAAPSGYMYTNTGSLAPIPGSKVDLEQRQGLDTLQVGLEVLQDQIDFFGEKGDYESGLEAKTLDARARQALIPAISQLYESGVLNQGERDAYMKEIHQFNELMSIPGFESTAQANMEALQMLLQRQYDDAIERQGRPQVKKPWEM